MFFLLIISYTYYKFRKMQQNQSNIKSTRDEFLHVVESDYNREGLTFSKAAHTLRLLFSKKATDLLESVDTFLDIDFQKLSDI
ncbi:MAG: hypothetical protein ACPHY8_06655 [Patescibacteria group bacterium]